jgi:hypothetical protein
LSTKNGRSNDKECVLKVFGKELPNQKENMPIKVNFAPSRRKKIEVDVVPAEWQLYIEQ